MEAVVIIYVYNESDNIRELIPSIMQLPTPLHIIVVDDNSSDSTGRYVEEFSLRFPQVTLLRRRYNRGRGYAAREAFDYIINNTHYKYIIEMDADFSHDPAYLPIFLEHIKNADVVIGSRYIKGGRDCERGIARWTLSQIARFCISKILSMPLIDPASGFKCFRREVIEDICNPPLASKDCFIISEMIYRCYKRKYRIKEVPIVFHKRRYGNSKLKARTCLWYVIRLIGMRLRGL